LKKEGKPKEIIEKIVQGKINKFYQEFCLLKQLFIKDDKKTVEQLVTEKIAKLGENIQIKRFVYFSI
jgi:elongation factor Ts